MSQWVDLLDSANQKYDNTSSGLTAGTVQGAIDEVASGGGGGTGPMYPYFVGYVGGYSTIAAAIAAITGTPSQTNPVTILVAPGYYTITASISVPEWVNIVGAGMGATVLTSAGSAIDIFTCGGHNVLSDFSVDGGTVSGYYVFNGNGGSNLHFRRVGLLNNGGTARQRFLKQIGSTWSVLFLEQCVIDYYDTSGYSIYLENTSSSSRLNDVIIDQGFFDAYQLTGYGGSIECVGCNDVRVKRSTIRGADTYNTGVRNSTSSVTGTKQIEVYHCDLSGGVPLYCASGTTLKVGATMAPGSIFDGTKTVVATVT